MSNAADVPISPQGLQQQQPAALAQETVSSQQLSAEQTSEGEVIESQVGDAEDREGQPDGAFRRRAPPVLSSEQLRSPLATPGKSPSIAINPSASVAAAADSNDEDEEEQLPQRRPRRESVAAAAAAAAAAKAAASAPTLATPQELVDWCIAQAVSVTTLPFEQAPSSVAAQVAAFSAVFQEQVRVAVLFFAICVFNHDQVVSLYRNQHKLVAEISRVEGDGDALALASAADFPAACSADVGAAAAQAYEAARVAAVAAEEEEQLLKRLHSEYSTLSSLCAQVDAGLVSSSIVRDGSALMQQVSIHFL